MDQAPLQAVHGLGFRVDFHANATGRLVDKVDGFVGQLAVGDVALGELRRSNNRGVRDVHPVVDLIALFEATQDGDRVFLAGLIHQHLLKAPLQGGVFLDVLSMLVQRGGADAVQLAASQGGLEHIARVHSALGFTRAHHGVQFIDEQDHAALFPGQLAQNGFQPLFEFTAKFSPR